MDILLQTTTSETTNLPLWDFVLTDGKIETLSSTAEQKQRAIVASFLQQGTVPQLIATGNPWVEMLSGLVSPVEVDARMRKNIQEQTNTSIYGPIYDVVQNKLIVTIKEGQNG